NCAVRQFQQLQNRRDGASFIHILGGRIIYASVFLRDESPSTNSGFYAWLSAWLILPQDHGWHHHSGEDGCNYGANLKLWDRLHGTWHASEQWPSQLGQSSGLPLWRQLLYPLR
ncbi:MAG: sterol desaturase family protein, partial [Cyanobacteria bacterium P01_F01_bin.116]